MAQPDWAGWECSQPACWIASRLAAVLLAEGRILLAVGLQDDARRVVDYLLNDAPVPRAERITGVEVVDPGLAPMSGVAGAPVAAAAAVVGAPAVAQREDRCGAASRFVRASAVS